MLNVRKIIDGILEDTGVKAGAEARIARRRAILEDEAARRLAAEGAAPSWKAPGAGSVSYSAAGDWTATVADDQALGSFLAEHHPTEVTATIAIPADALEDALTALGFAGINYAETRLSVASAYLGPYLDSLNVEVEEQADDEDGSVDRVITIVDPDGLAPDGLTATRKPPQLTVRLDPARKSALVEQSLAQLAEEVEDTPDDVVTDPAPQRFEESIGITGADGKLVAVGRTFDELRTDLERSIGADALKAIAGSMSLPVGGAKPVLAERIVRAWLAGARPVKIEVAR